MNFCGTCKYWGKKANPDPEFRECQAIHLGVNENSYEGGPTPEDIEDEPETSAERLKFRSENKAFTLDGIGYLAALRSRSDFGCVLHEPRED